MLHFGNLISLHFSTKRHYITQSSLYGIRYERIMVFMMAYMVRCVSEYSFAFALNVVRTRNILQHQWNVCK